MVYLPKDVDGLAIIEPESNKNPRIVAREKTPYFSKAKNDDSKDSEDEMAKEKVNLVKIPTFFSHKKPFSNTTEGNQSRRDNSFSRRIAYDQELRKNNDHSNIQNKKKGISSFKTFGIDKDDSQPNLLLERSMSEQKINLKGIREVDHRGQYRINPMLEKPIGPSDNRPEEHVRNHSNDNSVTFEVNSSWMRADPITLNHPESISSHVRAIRDPDPDNPDKKFTQLYMDDGFKKLFGTKLAVTPNKFFGTQDAPSVKKGSS
jgi:hypothetical protein